jgi:hypothetical protein
VRRIAVATKFCKDKLYHGTVPLIHEIQFIKQGPENIIRVYYTLKLGSFCCFYGQWAIGQRTAYPRPISAIVCQNRMMKSADLQRTQAGWTLAWRG